jgi:pyruvate/2-oxoglutarate/acetoin dehydrogenase E1 component
VFIEPFRLWRDRAEVPDGLNHTIPLGSAAIRRTGSDVTIVSWGWALIRATTATETLAQEGIHAELVDLRSLSPLDADTILASVEKTGRLVIVHDSPGPYGPGAQISALAAERAFDRLKAPIRIVAPPFAPAPFPSHLEDAFYPGTSAIASAVRDVVVAGRTA